MSELKPCANCSGEATRQAPNMHRMTCIACKECGMSTGWGTVEEVTATWNRRAQHANEPLTLERLREMHGQPVWVVPNGDIAKWYLVDVANDCCSTCDMDVVDFELYGPKDKYYGWLAYRRKPERSENDG